MSKALDLLNELEMKEAIPKNHVTHSAKKPKMWKMPPAKKVGGKMEALLQDIKDFKGSAEEFKASFDTTFLPALWSIAEELERPNTELEATPSTATEKKKWEFQIPKEKMKEAMDMLQQKMGPDAEIAQDGDDKFTVLGKDEVEEIVMMVLKDLGLIEDDDGEEGEEDDDGEEAGGEDDGEDQGEANKNLQKNGKAKKFGKGKKAGKMKEARNLPGVFGRQATSPDDVEAIEEIRKDTKGTINFMNSFMKKS